MRSKVVLQGIPSWECAGIYALVDELGKVYIGSAVNLRKRLVAHNRGLYNAGRGVRDAFESQALQDAAAGGHAFQVSILAAFPSGISSQLLRQIEREFIAEYAERGPLYNDRIQGRVSSAWKRRSL